MDILHEFHIFVKFPNKHSKITQERTIISVCFFENIYSKIITNTIEP
jgi:hypothetical protein